MRWYALPYRPQKRISLVYTPLKFRDRFTGISDLSPLAGDNPSYKSTVLHRFFGIMSFTIQDETLKWLIMVHENKNSVNT